MNHGFPGVLRRQACGQVIEMHDANATDIWKSGQLGPGEFALALDEDEGRVQTLVEILRRTASAGRLPNCDRQPFSGEGTVSIEDRVALTILHVLSCRAHVPLQPMAAALTHWPQLSASISRFLEFQPGPQGEELDPFLFFSPIAAEPLPLPAVDEYVDIIENRFVLWRRPDADPTPLALALSGSGPADNGDEGLDYLDALQRLKTTPSYDTVFLGFIEDDTFHPNIEAQRAAGREGLASSLSGSLDYPAGRVATLEDSYAHKVSVNASLAARQMKRRALGLQVFS